MSLIALTAAFVLASQDFVPAPTYHEADVARLESCVFGGTNVAACGNFSEDVRVLEACAARANLAGGPEGFADAWFECDSVLPCNWEKPQRDQGMLVVRNCSARGVAASMIIATRWRAQLDAQMPAEDRALLAQMEKMILDRIEEPGASDAPMDVRSRSSARWRTYLMLLRIVQLTGKAGF